MNGLGVYRAIVVGLLGYAVWLSSYVMTERAQMHGQWEQHWEGQWLLKQRELDLQVLAAKRQFDQQRTDYASYASQRALLESLAADLRLTHPYLHRMEQMQAQLDRFKETLAQF